MDEPKRRRLNASQRRALKSAEIARFIKTTGRKDQKGQIVNDRYYDPEHAKSLRRMKPEDFDRLMREDEE